MDVFLGHLLAKTTVSYLKSIFTSLLWMCVYFQVLQSLGKQGKTTDEILAEDCQRLDKQQVTDFWYTTNSAQNY